MSWTQRVKHPSEILKKGQRVCAVVLNVDKDNERLSLGLKQMEPDPWTLVETKYEVGQEVRVNIVKITNFGAFAELEDGVEGLIHLSELGQGKVTDPEEIVSVGQELDTKIIKIEVATRKIGLSIRAMTEEVERQEEPDDQNLPAEASVADDVMSESMSGLQTALGGCHQRTRAEAGTGRLRTQSFWAAVESFVAQTPNPVRTRPRATKCGQV